MTTVNLKAIVQGKSIDRTVSINLVNTQKQGVASFLGAIDVNGNLSAEIEETITEPVRIVISSGVGGSGSAILKTASSAYVSPVSNEIRYDFSIDIAQALGDNQVQISDGVWAIYNGDFNQDLSIDGSDEELFVNNENSEQDEMSLPDLQANIFNSVFAVLD